MPKKPVTPAQRFTPAPDTDRALVDLWLPAALEPAAEPAAASVPLLGIGGAVELEKAVPPSGNMYVCEQQFWLGPARAGQLVTFWVDCDMVHLSIAGTRIKTVRSHLSVTDLARLAAEGARPAGPPPLSTTPGQDGIVRSNGLSPASAPSPWPAGSSSPRRSSPAAGSGSASTAPRWPRLAAQRWRSQP
jgi:hypothetical protein